MKYTAEMFKAKLPRRHSRGYIAIPELRVGCGYAGLTYNPSPAELWCESPEWNGDRLPGTLARVQRNVCCHVRY
jgi:hypothetical protein